MQTFIEKIIAHVFTKYPVEKADRLCFVFPNRRAGIYLKMLMSERYKKNMWAPAVFSAEDFIAYLSGLEINDSYSILFELYDIYAKIEGANAKSPEEFLSWGNILLQDYNDSDLYMADTESLFHYLSEAKAISRWELDKKELSAYIKNYLDFYNSLGKYYSELKTHLLSKKQAYQGLAFRTTAENIETFSQNLPWDMVYFCGFNALTKSESIIIKHLVKSGKAETLWDCDDYYMNNPDSEAGKFLRNIRKEWDIKDFKWIEESFRNEPKHICITGIAGTISQTRYAGYLLAQNEPEENDYSKTAVVLADESLLIPMIYSVPAYIRDLNITMGYPLSLTPLADFFKTISELHLNAKRYTNKGKQRFYFKDIIKVLSHHFFSILSDDTEKSDVLLKELKTNNRAFYYTEDIQKIMIEQGFDGSLLPALLFGAYSNEPRQYLSFLQQILKKIKSNLEKNPDRFDKNTLAVYNEYLFSFAIIVEKVLKITNEKDFIRNLETLNIILKGFIDSGTLPFYGEPQKGMQIMGMLETRNIDFENLIILSVNEGILPGGKSQNTFIPFDIRNEFNLPTYKDKESIFAYHFYRLLQRAKNINLIYNTVTDNLNGGEISRFILQLRQELNLYSSHCTIEEKIITSTIQSGNEAASISIPKTPEIIDKLKTHAASGFSPTALHTYMMCSLRFYFQYVAGISEVEDVSETIDAATLGSAIHLVLEEIFSENLNKPLNAALLKKALADTEQSVKNAFRKHYPNGDIDNGKNLLIYKVAVKYIRRYLLFELEHIEKDKKILTVCETEKKLFKGFDIMTKEGSVPVNIRGISDRIDVCNGAFRIVDYKTGKINDNALRIADWSQICDDTDKAALFQLLVYSWMFLKDNSNAVSVLPCIISLRSLSKGEKYIETPEKLNTIEKDDLPAIEAILTDIAGTVFNSDIPFAQTENDENCQYCPYTNVCNR